MLRTDIGKATSKLSLRDLRITLFKDLIFYTYKIV